MSVGKKSFKKKDYQALHLLRSTAIAPNDTINESVLIIKQQ